MTAKRAAQRKDQEPASLPEVLIPPGDAKENEKAAYWIDLLGNVAEWLAADSSGAEQAPVAGGSYADPTADLLKVPVVKRSRLERARTIGFRVVVE